MGAETWQRVAARQCGLLTRVQLRAVGVDRWAVRHRVSSGRWLELSSAVISTTTGELSRDQWMWLGVLHGGSGAMLGELTAAECHGLRNWRRDVVTVVVPYAAPVPTPVQGVEFRRSRRDLTALRRSRGGLPVCRIEPAVLTWASRQRSPRTAEGVLAAAVQQRLTSAAALAEWVDLLSPLRGAERFRRVLLEIDGGAHSVGELDVKRMCRRFGLAPPTRQVRRRDSTGRWRYTDCEWQLPDGRTLVLEVDGGFHMEVEHWEDDIARQRALASPNRLVVHCTARELRDEPERVARDLLLLGVPRAA